MIKIKKIIIITAAVFSSLLFGLSFMPSVVSADLKNEACQGVALGGAADCGDPAATQGQVMAVVRTAINILSLIVGVIAVIMIIVGGLKYITSAGDSNNTTSAKNTILYAIIGLVIVVSAQLIVRFVLGRL
jgi:uncharacterized membrane protein